MVDNEMLKADNQELHKLLTESREDLQALQREAGEHSIAVRGKVFPCVSPVAGIDRLTSRDSIETLPCVEWTVFLRQGLGRSPNSVLICYLMGVKFIGSTRRPRSVDSRSHCAYVSNSLSY